MGMDIDAVGGKDVASNNDLHNMILNIEFVCLCVCVCVCVCFSVSFSFSFWNNKFYNEIHVMINRGRKRIGKKRVGGTYQMGKTQTQRPPRRFRDSKGNFPDFSHSRIWKRLYIAKFPR